MNNAPKPSRRLLRDRRPAEVPEENLDALIMTVAANATPRLPHREGVRLWKHRLLPEGRRS